MKTTLLCFLLILLTGCSTIQTVTDAAPTAAKSPTTFAVCKTVDIASTAYGIRAGLVHESNPILGATLSHGYFPMIAIGVGVWYLLDRLQDKTATLAGNTVTCGVAAHNLWLLK
jgi:uncharacterized protein YceK